LKFIIRQYLADKAMGKAISKAMGKSISEAMGKSISAIMMK
jgi:hypothetical protein